MPVWGSWAQRGQKLCPRVGQTARAQHGAHEDGQRRSPRSFRAARAPSGFRSAAEREVQSARSRGRPGATTWGPEGALGQGPAPGRGRVRVCCCRRVPVDLTHVAAARPPEGRACGSGICFRLWRHNVTIFPPARLEGPVPSGPWRGPSGLQDVPFPPSEDVSPWLQPCQPALVPSRKAMWSQWCQEG